MRLAVLPWQHTAALVTETITGTMSPSSFNSANQDHRTDL